MLFVFVDDITECSLPSGCVCVNAGQTLTLNSARGFFFFYMSRQTGNAFWLKRFYEYSNRFSNNENKNLKRTCKAHCFFFSFTRLVIMNIPRFILTRHYLAIFIY